MCSGTSTPQVPPFGLRVIEDSSESPVSGAFVLLTASGYECRTRTDQAGFAEFPDAPDGALRARATADGCLERERVVFRSETAETAVIRLRRACSLSGLVLDPEGQAVVGARVTLLGEPVRTASVAPPRMSRVSDRDGRFTFSGLVGGTTVSLQVVATGFAEVVEPTVPIPSQGEIVLRVQNGHRVWLATEGLSRDQNVLVQVLDGWCASQIDVLAKDLAALEGSEPVLVTELPKGTYGFRVTQGGTVRADLEDVFLKEDLVIPVMRRGIAAGYSTEPQDRATADVLVLVRDQRGDPVPRALVTVLGEQLVAYRTSPDGLCQVPIGTNAHDMIRVSHPRLQTAFYELDPEASPLIATLADVPNARFRLARQLDSGRPDFLVEARPGWFGVPRGKTSEWSGTFDEHGRTPWFDAPPGRWTLAVWTSDGAQETIEVTFSADGQHTVEVAPLVTPAARESLRDSFKRLLIVEEYPNGRQRLVGSYDAGAALPSCGFRRSGANYHTIQVLKNGDVSVCDCEGGAVRQRRGAPARLFLPQKLNGATELQVDDSAIQGMGTRRLIPRDPDGCFVLLDLVPTWWQMRADRSRFWTRAAPDLEIRPSFELSASLCMDADPARVRRLRVVGPDPRDANVVHFMTPSIGDPESTIAVPATRVAFTALVDDLPASWVMEMPPSSVSLAGMVKRLVAVRLFVSVAGVRYDGAATATLLGDDGSPILPFGSPVGIGHWIGGDGLETMRFHAAPGSRISVIVERGTRVTQTVVRVPLGGGDVRADFEEEPR